MKACLQGGLQVMQEWCTACLCFSVWDSFIVTVAEELNGITDPKCAPTPLCTGHAGVVHSLSLHIHSGRGIKWHYRPQVCPPPLYAVTVGERTAIEGDLPFFMHFISSVEGWHPQFFY